MEDLLILIILSLLNGFFSASEIAIVSFKKGRLKTLLEQKDKRAQIIEIFQRDANHFFATVQIGVTLLGTIASVFGGAKLVGDFAQYISSFFSYLGIEMIAKFSEEISFIFIVLLITYLQIVIGELVPKSLALRYSEMIGLLFSYPLLFFNKLFYILSNILTLSSNLILKLFKDKTSFSETKLLAEEILHLLDEGVRKGTLEKTEHEMIQNILEMNETDAREVMIPRVDMIAIPVDMQIEEVISHLNYIYSRIPVYKDSLDNIVGILHIKDLIKVLWKKEKISLSKLIRPPYFVPEGMKIGKILKEMQKKKNHIAIVVDEYGGTSGLLTLEDILEEIVGDIEDITDNSEQPILRINDFLLVSGNCNIFDFNEYIEEELIPESESYNTIAGFIIEHLGRFPEIGEPIIYGNYEFILVKKSRQKMVQFKIKKIENKENLEKIHH